jgi:ribosomal-protein-alanine N-acetyltransferase
MINFKLLHSNRLEYRPFEEEDFDDLFEILSNEEVCKFIPGPASFNEEQVRKYLRFLMNEFDLNRKSLVYAVTLKGDDQVIGFCGCSYIKEFEKNEIKYFLNERFFGRGYGLEMAFKMKHVAMNLGFKHLVGLADVNNTASCRILEKIGYKFIENIELWGSNLSYYEIEL